MLQTSAPPRLCGLKRYACISRLMGVFNISATAYLQVPHRETLGVGAG